MDLLNCTSPILKECLIGYYPKVENIIRITMFYEMLLSYIRCRKEDLI